MGGRGSERDIRDKWDFVKELSDFRLQRYGLMTEHKIDQKDDQFRKEAFNWALGDEYFQRHGSYPSWYRK